MLVSTTNLRLTLLIPVIILIFLLHFAFQNRGQWQNGAKHSLFGSSTYEGDIRDDVQKLFAPIIHGYTEPLVLEDGLRYEIHGRPKWTQPLKNRLCIVDVDTRPMDQQDEPWNHDKKFNWHNIGSSAGILNHYMYAKIHGYDYKFMHITPFPDRDAPWARIPALSTILDDYQIIVSVDADVVFPHLHVPYEWLLNQWNFTEETAIAVPLEPNMKDWGGSRDRKGRQNDNAGFMTLQNVPRSQEMLKYWTACPEAIEGCKHFKKGWPAEQGAFNEYVRYKYPDMVREVPCNDGLGYPGMSSNCHGRLVSHYTLDKKHVKDAVQKALSFGIMQRLQADLQNRTKELKVERLNWDLASPATTEQA